MNKRDFSSLEDFEEDCWKQVKSQRTGDVSANENVSSEENGVEEEEYDENDQEDTNLTALAMSMFSKVSKSKQKRIERKNKDEPEVQKRTVFLNNIPFSMKDKDELTKWIEEAGSVDGKILNTNLVLNTSGESRGYAYVEFENQTDAEAAALVLNGKEMCKRIIEAKISTPLSGRKKERKKISVHDGSSVMSSSKNTSSSIASPSSDPNMSAPTTGSSSGKTHSTHPTTIFISGLGKDVDTFELCSIFSKCGKIMGVKVMRDKKSNLCNGHGLIQFSTPDEVSEAMKLDGTKWRNFEVQVKMSRHPVVADAV